MIISYMFNERKIKQLEDLYEMGISDLFIEYDQQMIDIKKYIDDCNHYSEIMTLQYIEEIIKIIQKRVEHLQKTLDNYKEI